MEIIIKNTEEAKEHIDKIKGVLIADLMFSRLMQEPEPVRRKVYEMLVRTDETGD